jgi:hypothetical protein
MRFSSEEKIKDIVTYFQIGMTLFFTVGYQVIPRMINLEGLTADFTIHWYSYLIPPVWMAMALESVHQLNFDSVHLAMLFLAIVCPITLFWVMNKYLAPSFSRQLSNMSGEATKKTAAQDIGHEKRGWSSRLSKLVCSSPVERGAFEITWKITARDKGFRLQFYPALGYIPIFIFLIVFNGGRDMEQQLPLLPYSNKFLWLIYLPLFAVASSLSIATFNENFQASWIYHSMPVDKPGQLISGNLKALIVKFFVPVYLAFFALSLFVWGGEVIGDFIFGFFNSLVSLLVVSHLSQKFLPFSRQPNVKQQSGRFLQIIIQMVIIGLLVLIHYLLLSREYIMYGVALVSAAGLWVLVKNLQDMPWRKISV